METMMIKGSCCCGTVKFELSEMPTMMGTCHCTRCRKLGSSTFVFAKKEYLKWIQGHNDVGQYTPEAPYKYSRCFCKKCGSSLGEILSNENSFPIPANIFDDDLPLKPSFHEFIDEKPSWYDICDNAKQFSKHPHS
jgi:hypothetical protein